MLSRRGRLVVWSSTGGELARHQAMQVTRGAGPGSYRHIATFGWIKDTISDTIHWALPGGGDDMAAAARERAKASPPCNS